jgi:hypothetical protein
MGQRMKRFFAPILTALLIAGVGFALYRSISEQSVVEVKGLIGSEKEEFFRDPRVVEALKNDGLRVDFVKAGSREIATKFDLKAYDFTFPAGVPAAEKIRRDNKIQKFYPAFFTPMSIASWKRVVKPLEANKIAEQKGGIYYVIDMPRLLELVKQHKRWNELPSNDSFSVGRAVLINSTDVRSSNSAAMYLSLASYVYNHDNIVDSDAQIRMIIDDLTALFARQGFTGYSSEAPFQDYLTKGPGNSPLVMIYEAQFLSAKAQDNSPVSDEMVLLYPKPTVFTKHILVPLSPAGEKLGEALMNDPELKRLAIEHGFRNDDRPAFQEFIKRHGLGVPDEFVDVVEVPSYELIERMIASIEESYKGNPANVPNSK